MSWMEIIGLFILYSLVYSLFIHLFRLEFIFNSLSTFEMETRKPVFFSSKLATTCSICLSILGWYWTVNCSHTSMSDILVCTGRKQGADTIERPSACHHPSLALFQTVSSLSEVQPLSHSCQLTGRLPFWSDCRIWRQRRGFFLPQKHLTCHCMSFSIAYTARCWTNIAPSQVKACDTEDKSDIFKVGKSMVLFFW